MKKILFILTLVLFVSFVFAVDENSQDTNVEVQIACTSEGQTMPVYPGYACCEGLIAINPQTTEEPLVGASICSNCGNESCEQWENQYNCPADCKQENPPECVYTTEYAPVCGTIKTCTTNCETNNSTSDETNACESTCYRERKSFSNAGEAKCAGAESITKGKCTQNCPIYAQPNCPNGKIEVIYDDIGCRKARCVAEEAEHFSGAY